MMSHDMTESVDLTELEKKYLYRYLLNTINQTVLVINEEGWIILSNQVSDRCFAMSGDSLIGHNVNEIVLKPALLDAIRENYELLKGGKDWSGNFLVSQGDGTRRSIDIQFRMLEIKQKKLYSLLSWPEGHSNLHRFELINQIIEKLDALPLESTKYNEAFKDIAQAIVPDFGDWCFIHILNDQGVLELAASAPDNARNNQAFYDWLQNDLPNDDEDGLLAVMNNLQPVLVPKVSTIRRASEAGIKSYLIVPITTHLHSLGTISLLRVSAGDNYNENEVLQVKNLAHHIATSIERSHIHHESKRLKKELEQRVGEGTVELKEALTQLRQSEELLQALFRISNKLNATLDVNVILDTLAQEAIQLVSGESGFAGLHTAEGMTVHKYYQQGIEIPFEHTWQLGDGIPGWVLRYKVPYGTSDAANDPLIKHDLSINTDIRSVICTPILDTVGEVIAYFDIRNKIGAEGFSINDQEMLLMLAPVASIAIQNALAYQQRMANVSELKESAMQLQELAANLEMTREEERTQIARELHDQLGQALTAIKFDLKWLSGELSQKDDVLAQKTKDISSQINALIKTVRRIATELRPGMLEDLGLVASVEWQARDFEKRTGVKIDYSLPEGDLVLPKELSLAIFRISQEALTNIARYADATQVDITLLKTGDLITFEVCDNGKGISQEKIIGQHSLGLIGMRERTRHLGGTFEITGKPGEGTTIKVIIPINSTRKI